MDNFAKSCSHMFSVPLLNRAHNRRKRPEWLRERLDDPESFFVPVWQSRVLVSDDPAPRAVYVNRRDIEPALVKDEEVLFLGEENDRGYFAVEVRDGDSASPAPLARFGRFRDLRAVGPLLSRKDGAILAYAKTLTFWHGRNHFCGVCGSPTINREGGHFRQCSNDSCDAVHFPRTDPAIIVLIHRGDQCLLARQPGWPDRMYSVLAGFVEPGESAEAAVMREAFEEAGVHVKEIYYQSSQPWPFPCSLMLAFTAEAEDTRIRLRDRELEDARWFSADDLRREVEVGTVHLPSRISVAYHLLEDWFNGVSSTPLGDLAATHAYRSK